MICRDTLEFRTSAPDTVLAGQPFDLIDLCGDTASTCSGTVHFTLTHFDAELPNDYTFGVADSRAHTFTVMLFTGVA